MVIVQGVIHLSAFFARAHQPHLPQAAHVMRDGGLAETGGLGQRADVHLALRQRRDEAYTVGVAEGAKQFRHLGGGAFIQRGGFGGTGRHRLIYEQLFR